MANVYGRNPRMHGRPMEIPTPPSRKRRSRMRRTSTGRHLELQPRDFEIFRLLSRYRYLRSTQIHRFVGGDRTKLLERLGDLFHEGGYLNRPPQQWETLGSRCQHVVYEIAAKATTLLREQGDDDGSAPVASFGDGRQFQHTLMVCEVLAETELAANERGARFIPWSEIKAKAPRSGSVPQIAVSISSTVERGRTEYADVVLIPDAVFGLEYVANGTRSYRFFALEADRGTMPVERRGLGQSNYLKKILSYRQVLASGFHRTIWGIPNLLILNVIPNQARLANVMELLREVSAGHGSTSFLFRVCGTAAPPDVYRRVGYADFSLLRP